MKKVIILFFVILLCGCSAEKPAKTMSSMQTEPTETTVEDTQVTEVTEAPTTKETEPVIETPKTETTETTATERPEQSPVPDTTNETIAETPIAPINTEATTEPPTTLEMPIEMVEEDKPTELSETVETPPESVTEPPRAEFDVNYWIDFARSYAFQIGLEIDETAVDCWDNPITANADCIYLERDLKSRFNRYVSDEDIAAVNIWAESLGNGNYLIYIAYA